MEDCHNTVRVDLDLNIAYENKKHFINQSHVCDGCGGHGCQCFLAQQANNDTDTARVGEVVVTALGIKKEKRSWVLRLLKWMEHHW